MSQKVNVQGYYEYMKMPWGKLFYELAWHNIECQGKRVLDFGSGFGYTADHFAKSNEVIAVEPNEEMIENRFSGFVRQDDGNGGIAHQVLALEIKLHQCHGIAEEIKVRFTSRAEIQA